MTFNTKRKTQRTEESDQDILDDETIFPPFRNGPLTDYRKAASFCWKRMKYLVEGAERIQFNPLTMDPETILFTLDWLCAYLLKRTAQKVIGLGSKYKSAFDVRNDSQVFHARDLAIVYGQRNIYFAFYNYTRSLQKSAEKRVLAMLLSFYGADLITKQSGWLYQGGYFIGPKPAELYKEGILKLLEQLKPESVALVDALSPTDFVLNSALGVSDGNVYQQLEKSFMTAPGGLERPKWWREVVYKDFLKTKL